MIDFEWKEWKRVDEDGLAVVVSRSVYNGKPQYSLMVGRATKDNKISPYIGLLSKNGEIIKDYDTIIHSLLCKILGPVRDAIITDWTEIKAKEAGAIHAGPMRKGKTERDKAKRKESK